MLMKSNFTAFFLIACVVLLCGLASCSDNNQSNEDKKDPDPVPSEPATLVLDTLGTGLVNPWGMDFLPDGGIIFTQRSGILSIWRPIGISTVSGVPAIVSSGQGGLLDVALSPDFSSSSLIYFSASATQGSGFSTALFRARLNGNALQQVEKLFQSEPLMSSTQHFGNRIVFDTQGHVFLCFGDRGSQNLAQNNSNHAGTVVRLNLDGTVPADNPFVGQVGVKPEIWSYGHRNPQGMVRNKITGELWLHEHGPQGGDELNLIEKGQNYGWPLATFGVNYNGSQVSKDTFVEGTVLPVHYWVPSIAPCGMDFYLSDSIPQWKGNLFLGALAGQHLNMLEIKGRKVVSETRLLQGFARFRCVRQGPDGYLYFLTESPGLLCRYRPAHGR